MNIRDEFADEVQRMTSASFCRSHSSFVILSLHAFRVGVAH